jgi:hypothetical protein
VGDVSGIPVTVNEEIPDRVGENQPAMETLPVTRGEPDVFVRKAHSRWSVSHGLFREENLALDKPVATNRQQSHQRYP